MHCRFVLACRFLFVLSYLSSDHVGGLAVQKAPKGGWVLATAEIPARTLWRGNLLNLKTENCIEQDIGSGKKTISTHSSSSGITTHNSLFLEMCLLRSVSKACHKRHNDQHCYLLLMISLFGPLKGLIGGFSPLKRGLGKLFFETSSGG